MLYRAGTLSVVLIFASLIGLQSLHAEMYKFTDKDGIVHYTNVRPTGQKNVKSFSFPCYASDPSCNQLDWESIPLNRHAFNQEIEAASEVFTVDESLIRAIIHAESAYQPEAQSPKGAQGLMQLMPATQKELQVDNVFDPLSNIEGGTLYLSRLLNQFDHDVELAAAAYLGEGSLSLEIEDNDLSTHRHLALGVCVEQIHLAVPVLQGFLQCPSVRGECSIAFRVLSFEF